MTELDKPVVRRTPLVIQGRKVIATANKEGVHLRQERLSETHHISWAEIWRHAQRNSIPFHIPARTK